MSSVLEVPVQLALAILLAVDPAPAPVEPVGRDSSEAGSAWTQPRRLDFGYSDETWLALVQTHGTAAGLGPLAGRAFRTSSGRIYVPMAEDRQAILELKLDPAIAPLIATEAARANASHLQNVLARPAAPAELFMAHHLGAEATTGLLLTAARDPQWPATEIAPAAALEHPEAFFQDVRPRSVAGVVRVFAAAFERAVTMVRPMTMARPMTVMAAAKPSAPGGGNAGAHWSTAVTPAPRARRTAAAH